MKIHSGIFSFLSIGALILSALSISGLAQQEIGGYWRGTMQNGMTVVLHIKADRAVSNETRAYVISNNSVMHQESVPFRVNEKSEVTFSFPSQRSQYTGIWNAESNEINGTSPAAAVKSNVVTPATFSAVPPTDMSPTLTPDKASNASSISAVVAFH